MPARLRKDYPVIQVYDSKPTTLTEAQRAAVGKELGDTIPASRHEEFCVRLDVVFHGFDPWYRRETNPPSLSERKAGLLRTAELADELARAIHGGGVGREPCQGVPPGKSAKRAAKEHSIIASDWHTVNGHQLDSGYAGLFELEKQLDALVRSCRSTLCRLEKPRKVSSKQERYGDLALTLASLLFDVTGTVPAVSVNRGAPFLHLLVFCTNLLREPECREPPYRPLLHETLRPYATAACAHLKRRISEKPSPSYGLL